MRLNLGVSRICSNKEFYQKYCRIFCHYEKNCGVSPCPDESRDPGAVGKM